MLSVEIEEAGGTRSHWVLKFAGVDSIADARAGSRNSDLWVPASERGKLPEGEYFRSDLTWLSVVNEATGEELAR